eukprot:15444392-Alexandrium_andersonii.AAC.1
MKPGLVTWARKTDAKSTSEPLYRSLATSAALEAAMSLALAKIAAEWGGLKWCWCSGCLPGVQGHTGSVLRCSCSVWAGSMERETDSAPVLAMCVSGPCARHSTT